MKRLLILASLILTTSLVGQVEHAPTVAQCQADQKLWDSKIESKLGLPEVGILQKWTSEMEDCMTVDSQHQLQYVFTASEVDTETVLRMMHFLQRHNMLEDFKTEDAAGKR
jgi:hypothetical protein